MLNNNFSKLVKLYEKYQKQQRNQILLKLFGVVALLAGGYFIYEQVSSRTAQTESVETATQETAPAAETANSATATPAVETPQKEHVRPLQKTIVSTPKTESMPKVVHKRKPTKSKKQETFQLKVTQRESLYKLLVDYKDKKSYNAAIRIARFYLQEKDYNKAVKWAVEASKKDPAQAESWIIYARAKKALGKPDVAKQALGIYLKHNYSQPAQNLLDSL